MQKYNLEDIVEENNQIKKTEEKIESVKLIMQENISKLLENSLKAEEVLARSESLQEVSSVFRKNSRQLRRTMWWKNMKMWAIVVAVSLIVVAVIVLIVVTASK